jgi:hypothetical protein
MGLRQSTGCVKAPRVFPIAVLSFRNDEKLAIKAIKAGAQDYLVKGSLTEGVSGACHPLFDRAQKPGRREQERRKSGSRLVFEKAPLGIALINLQTGKYYDVNPNVCLPLSVAAAVDQLLQPQSIGYYSPGRCGCLTGRRLSFSFNHQISR